MSSTIFNSQPREINLLWIVKRTNLISFLANKFVNNTNNDLAKNK